MKYKVPAGFKIGSNMPAWQVEGSYNKLEGHTHFPDMMYQAYPERWHNGVGPSLADLHYDRYEDDIKLIAETGCQQIRINIDWSRFIQDFETGEVNEKEAKHYEDVIKCYQKNGIEVIMNLEHWELPKYYFDKYDGYASRKVIDMYVKYAEEAFKRYGSLIEKWFTFNEPIVIPSLCLMDGFWYPYICDTKRGMNWIHGKNLASALAIKKFHEMGLKGKIGIILNPAYAYPRSLENPGDVKARDICEALNWGAFMDPAIKGEYPQLLIDILKKENCMFDYTQEEMDIIKNNTVDILGFNYYQPLRVKEPDYEWNKENFNFRKYYQEWDMPGKRMNPYRGWEIYPKALYDVAKRIKEEYGNIEWYVAESGMGVENEDIYRNDQGMIEDDYRIDFIKEHLAWLFKAVEEGCNCKGYWLFAAFDNCSPLNAYKNRYGLVEVDLKNNRARKKKKSALFYKEMIDNQEFELFDIDEDYLKR